MQQHVRGGACPGTIPCMTAVERPADTRAKARACALLETVHALVPAIRAAAPEIEQTREIPKLLFERMADAGIFHMLVPHQLGGAEIDLPSFVQIVEEIGKADAST